VRIRIDLAYDGAEFRGWATQPGLRTVQATLEGALATVLRLPAVSVTCAGRTDAGVHARGQVAHVAVADAALAASAGRATDPPEDVLARRLNGVLPPAVRVHRVSVAAAGFDARFSALWRRYRYRVVDHPDRLDPLTRGHVLAWPRPLDVAAMGEAAGLLVGEHDFAAFCRRREGASTVRTLLEYRWSRDLAGGLVADVRADAFCHSMVRALVGCCLAVGEGRHEPSWAGEVLAARERDPRVAVVPPHGLVLEEVAYPPDAELETQADRARVLRTLLGDAGT
jgi:tRNA pseudouridine38-40 synthase